MDAAFSKREAIRIGWEAATRNLGFFIIVLIIVGVVDTAPSMLRRSGAGFPLFTAIAGIASFVIGQVVSMGLIRIGLRVVDQQKPEVADLFSTLPLFWNYLFASILYGLVVLAGVILLVIPGIIWAIKYSQYGFLVVDKGAQPVEALRRSGELTQGSKWNLFLFGLVVFGVLCLGVLALFVGLFVAIPTVLVASAFVYRKLLARAEGAPATPVPAA